MLVGLASQGLGLPLQGVAVRDAPAQTEALEDTQLDLGHVQPAAVPGRVITNFLRNRLVSSGGKVAYSEA